MACDFSYRHYNELLVKIKEKGFTPIFYHEAEAEKSIILRHDLDQSCYKAYEIAKLEKENGMKATYFVWLNSPFYNLFQVENRDIIRSMIEMGHEIGLHFDETAYKIDSIDDMKAYIYKEKRILESYFGITIKSISFHRPSQLVLNKDIEIEGMCNTYSKKFFEEFKYISDSRGIWREGCLCQLLDKDAYKKLQVLTHPLWWGEEPKKNLDRIDEFFQEQVDRMNEQLAANISIYKKKDLKLSERG